MDGNEPCASETGVEVRHGIGQPEVRLGRLSEDPYVVVETGA